MFTSFDEKAFWKAISEKDMLRLKINTVSAMRSDPTFERGEADKVISILEKEIPEIFEEEVTLGYEERIERSKWDKNYFTKLTYWFQENFAKSRIPHIKEVGQIVHEDTARNYAKSMAIKNSVINTNKQTNTGVSKKRNPIHAPEKKRKFPLAGAIAAVAALVLLVVLLIKMFAK